MKAMILAAGFGTRFRPVTYTLPKPLVPLCNRPLIGWALEPLLAAGVREVIVNLHHLPTDIERWLRARYGADVAFEFSLEDVILGTGGGVRRVRERLEQEEDFFLVNGDTVHFPPYAALAEARRERLALAAITLRHPPQGDKFTAVFFEDGLVTGFGRGSGEPLMFAGSHCISRRIFECLPDKDFSGIVDEVYQPAIDSRVNVIAGLVDDGLWFDIGTPQRYLSASVALLAAIAAGDVPPPESSRVRGDSLVDDSATITGSLERSSVGARSIVEGTLRDTSVWDDCAIGAEVRLERCIVAHGVELDGDVTLRDTLVCRDNTAIPTDTTCERRDGLVLVHV